MREVTEQLFTSCLCIRTSKRTRLKRTSDDSGATAFASSYMSSASARLPSFSSTAPTQQAIVAFDGFSCRALRKWYSARVVLPVLR